MYSVTSSIGIDAAHRVPDHRSKCFNLHGHRYTINCTAQAHEVHKKGEQTGMVIDFSFLKAAMMGIIHDNCDHALLWYINDPLIRSMFGLTNTSTLRDMQETFEEMEKGPAGFLYRFEQAGVISNTMCLNFVPTAENLAAWWFWSLYPEVLERSMGLAVLTEVEVYETPNNKAVFEPGPRDSEKLAGIEQGIEVSI